MILISECGSTKCDWILLDEAENTKTEFRTHGMNLTLSSDSEIHKLLVEDVKPFMNGNSVNSLYFYGAGIRDDNAEHMKNLLSLALNPAYSEVNSDILAAARSLCGHTPGIACILGTGSNSCVYDGNKIIHRFYSPGYFFGDEGGGVHMGKILINDLLRNRLPDDLSTNLLRQYSLNREEIMENVYRKQYPNRYLAGFVPFIFENIENSYMSTLVTNSLDLFFREQLLELEASKTHTVHFTGSIAFHFKDFLIRLASHYGIKTGVIVKSPLEGLIEYHKK
jgi:N-acetylglucosamine kinase-like BadF-type ATPase